MVVYENKKNVLEYLQIPCLEAGIVHCHKEFEAIVCISGKAKAVVNDTEYSLSEGSMLLVFPYNLHSYENIENGEYRLFIFSYDFLYGVKNLSSQNNLCGYKGNEKISRIIKTLDSEYNYHTKENYSDMLLVGCINIMMREMIMALDITEGGGSFRLEQRLIEYCVKNSDKKISLKDVSDELLISPTKISKALKNNFGLSFPNFINTLRVSNACIMLKDPEISITKIAYDVGFESIRNFNRVFYKFMNRTPADYRKSNR